MEFTCFWSNCHTHFWRSSCSWCCECERDAEAQQKMNLVDENLGASSTPHRGNQPETISAMVNTVGHENTSFGSSLRSPLVSARTACGRGNPGVQPQSPSALNVVTRCPCISGVVPECTVTCHESVSRLPRAHGLSRLFLQLSPRWPGQFASDLGDPKHLAEGSFTPETVFWYASSTEFRGDEGRGSGRLLEHGIRR